MLMRELAAQFLALAEKQGATVPLMVGHRLMGSLCCSRATLRKPSAFRSGNRALRSCRASPAGDAIWPRRRVTVLGLSVIGSVVAWVSRGGARGCRTALKDAREIGHAAYADVCAITSLRSYPYPSAEIRGSNRASQGACRSGRGKRCLVLEGIRDDEPRLRFGPDRQSLGCDSNHYLRDYACRVNGSHSVGTRCSIAFGYGLCGAWTIR